MNYLWEAMLQLRKQGVTESTVRFKMPQRFSSYMELSIPCLNQEEMKEGEVIEVNPYYRFYNIFKDFYQPDLKDYPMLRDNLFHLIFHLLAQNDALSGMTKEEYHKKLLYRDLEECAFGESSRNAIGLFTRDEREFILSGMLKQYETGSSLDMFKDMMEELIPDNIVYHSNQNSYEIMVFIGRRMDKTLEGKMGFLVNMFVELPYHVEIYYEHHFGIMAIEETMEIDEIIMC